MASLLQHSRHCCLFVVGLSAYLTGCTQLPPEPEPAAKTAIQIEEAWSPALYGGVSRIVYFNVENGSDTDDTILAASSNWAADVSFHKSAVHEGIVSMTSLNDGIVVPAHTEVKLTPGGLHLMLSDLKGRAEPGDQIIVTLTFATAGVVNFEASVRDTRLKR